MSNGLKIGLGILAMVLVIGAIVGIIMWMNVPSQAVIPQTCSLTKNGATTGSYKCPAEASSCSVTVKLQCNTQSISPKVILRWSNNANILQFEPDQLAIDYDGDGDLDRWQKTSTSGGSPSPSLRFPAPYDDAYIGYYNGKVLVCHPRSGTTSYLCRHYEQGGSIPISLTATEPYASQGLEIYSGSSSAYQCTQQVTGAVSRTVTYSGATSGSKTDTFTIGSNQVINWNGEISYVSSESKSSECTKNIKVSSNTYYECKVDSNGCGVVDRTQAKSCGTFLFNEVTGLCEKSTSCTAENGVVLTVGQSTCLDKYTAQKCVDPPTMAKEFATAGKVCTGGVIQKAYDVEAVIQRSVVSTGEKFIVDFELKNTINNKNIPVTASIIKGSQTFVSSTQFTGTTPINAGKTQFTLDAPPIGYYTLKISFVHPDGDFHQDYDIRVTDSLSLIPKVDNPIQYDNNQIKVILESYKGGSFKDLTNYEVDAEFNGVKKYATIVQSGGQGRLIFLYDVKGDGTLRVRFRGNDETGLWTQWTDYKEVAVKRATILLSGDFKTNVCKGTYTHSFTTKDSLGQLVDTSNTVLIERPLQGETGTPSVSGSGGQYSFTYNHDQQGLYVIRITSTHPTLGVSQLNGGTGETVTILGGANCDSGGGGGGDGETNWTMYILIGGLVAAIGLFLFILFRRRR